MSPRRVLRAVRAPGEGDAEERAWAVVRAAYREAVPARRRSRHRPVALAIAVAVLIGASLSPAGATVGGLIKRALGSGPLGVTHAARALYSLPAAGRLLVSGPGGTWTIGADGAARRLGPWSQASYSPRGLYIGVAGRDQIAAVDPRGVTQWSLARPGASNPRWFSPSGYRVAYLSRRDLRVVAGDSTDDHLVARGVARVAPAWRPGRRYQLAYVSARHRLVVVDGDSRATLWSAPLATRVTKLAWSEDGRRLLVLSRGAAELYTVGDTVTTTRLAIGRGRVIDGSLAPSGDAVALVLGGSGSDVVLVETLGARRPAVRRVLAGAALGQAVWSPDGRWLLVTWPAADQWVFIRVHGTPRITAVSRIAQQYGGRHGFPVLDGWCCSVQGAAG